MNKYIVVFLTVIGLFFTPFFQSYAQNVLFEENFSDGFTGWSKYGSPKSTIVDIYGKTTVFDNKGDSWCQSGIITTTETVDVYPGITVSGDVYMAVSNYKGCWSSIGISLSAKVPVTTGDCANEGYYSSTLISWAYQGNACWASPNEQIGHTLISTNGGLEGLGVDKYINDQFIADGYNNGWHTLKAVVRADYRVDVFIDSNYIGTSIKPIDSQYLSNSYINLLGRSYGYLNGSKVYLDNVRFTLSETWYYDYDGDGYGDSNNYIDATSQPSGYVSNKTDCNDNDASIHPGATEIAGDGIDQDCNGSDLQVSKTWYQDNDGDGYGNPNQSMSVSTQPYGYVMNKTDCNDSDPNVNPSATEYQGDSIDQNCDGLIDPIGAGSNLKINQFDNGNFSNVSMFVTVTDQNGNFVSGLDETNFGLKENGTIISPLKVSSVSSGSSPLSIGVTIDKSGSMGSSGMASAKSAVNDFIKMSTGAQDEFGIVAFDQTVTTVKDFTTDKQALETAVNSISFGGLTAIKDAIYETLTLTSKQPGIRAVIVFTDGMDGNSSKKEADVIAYAKTLKIPVYTIGIGGVSKTTLQNIATQTGGTYSDADFTNLAAIYQALQKTIKQQYEISFQSKSTLIDDRCYDLDVTLSNGTKYTAYECVYGCSTCNPPVISLYADTKKMLQSGGAPSFGSSVSIKALVTDPDGDAIFAVNLYYRTSGTNNIYTKLPMSSVSSYDPSLYGVEVPEADYKNPGIDFYITASDGTYTKKSNEFTIGPGTSCTNCVEQIYIVAPLNNETLSYGSTNGDFSFGFTKVTNAVKYLLHLELKDLIGCAFGRPA